MRITTDRRSSDKWDRRAAVSTTFDSSRKPSRPERRCDLVLRGRVEEIRATTPHCQLARCSCWLEGLRALYRELKSERFHA